MAPKRVVLNQRDAAHVYEWLRMYWLGDKQTFGGCASCEAIAKRLELVIGPVKVRRIANIVRKHPNWLELGKDEGTA